MQCRIFIFSKLLSKCILNEIPFSRLQGQGDVVFASNCLVSYKSHATRMANRIYIKCEKASVMVKEAVLALTSADSNLSKSQVIADVAISKRPLLFTVWTQLRLRSHQIFYEIFTRKQFFPTSAGNAQAQLHFCG